MIWTLAQIPYWICRLVFGLQIVSSDSAKRRPVSIKELMVFTALAAISMTLMQFSYSRGVNLARVDPERMLELFLLPLSIFISGSFVLICLPSILLLFSTDSTSAGIYILIAGLITLSAVTALILAMQGGRAVWLTLVIWLFAPAFGIPLIIHRQNGFYMKRKH